MLDLFKSQARREREAIRDAVIEAIVKSEAAARAEISLLETAVEPALRTEAATRLVDVLLGCERTEKDVAIWQARADSLKARGHLHDALGTNLGDAPGRLRRSPAAPRSPRMAGRVACLSRLEALLRQLVARHGFEAWPVAYLDHSAFEKHRLSLGPRRSVEEALQSSQPETSTMAYVSTATAFRLLSRARLPGADAARDLLADRQRRRQAGRLDPEQLHDARTAVLRRPGDVEIGAAAAGARELRPHAAVGRQQRVVAEARPVAADVGGEGRRRGRRRRCSRPGPGRHRPAIRRRDRSGPGRRDPGSGARRGRRRSASDRSGARTASGRAARSSGPWRDGAAGSPPPESRRMRPGDRLRMQAGGVDDPGRLRAPSPRRRRRRPASLAAAPRLEQRREQGERRRRPARHRRAARACSRGCRRCRSTATRAPRRSRAPAPSPAPRRGSAARGRRRRWRERARRWRRASAGLRRGVATISLPQRRCATPCASQYG